MFKIKKLYLISLFLFIHTILILILNLVNNMIIDNLINFWVLLGYHIFINLLIYIILKYIYIIKSKYILILLYIYIISFIDYIGLILILYLSLFLFFYYKNNDNKSVIILFNLNFIKNFFVIISIIYSNSLLYIFNLLKNKYFVNDLKKSKSFSISISNSYLFVSSILYYFKNVKIRQLNLVYCFYIIVYFIEEFIFNNKKINYSKIKSLVQQCSFFSMFLNLLSYIVNNVVCWRFFIFRNIIIYLFYFINGVWVSSDTLNLFENFSTIIIISSIWAFINIYHKYKKNKHKYNTYKYNTHQYNIYTHQYDKYTYRYNKYTNTYDSNYYNNNNYLHYKSKLNSTYYKRANYLNDFYDFYLGSLNLKFKWILSIVDDKPTFYCLRLVYSKYIINNIKKSERLNVLFDFKYNLLYKKQLERVILLVAFDYILNNELNILEKNNTINLKYKEYKDNFINFYWKKYNVKSVLTLDYINDLLEPVNQLENMDFDETLKIHLNNILDNNLDNIRDIIKQAFIKVDNINSELKINNKFLDIINIEKLNKDEFINFIKNMSNFYNLTKLSNVLNDFDIPDISNLDVDTILDKFTSQDMFYLDYLSLTYNYNKFSLCYLIFVFKVLKITQEYKFYVRNCIRQHFSKDIFRYKLYLNNKFYYLVESAKFYFKHKAYRASVNFKYYDRGSLQYVKKRNSFLYLKWLQKINNRKSILELKDEDSVFNYLSLSFYKRYQDIINKPVPDLYIKTFDDFVYPNFKLDNETFIVLQEKEKYLKKLFYYYNFDENDVLLNYEDLHFYYYNIDKYKDTENDIYFFFNIKNSDFLNFSNNSNNINEKVNLQNNYFLVYYNYILKSFTNRETYFSNVYIEDIVLKDVNFVYNNLDSFNLKKKQQYSFYLDKFLNGFKFIYLNKRKANLNLIKNITLKYPRFLEILQATNFIYIYDKFSEKNKQVIYNIEEKIDYLYHDLNHNLTIFYNLREKFVSWISLLNINKLDEFMDFSMFNTLKGFVHLRQLYYIVLEELIEEERLLDHLINITTCVLRIMDTHYEYIRRNCLLEQGLFVSKRALSIEEWDYIFKFIEPKRPLIWIELYNSKASFNNSFFWNPNISFKEIIYALSHASERTWAYADTTESLEWNNFLDLYKKRNVVIYDLYDSNIESILLMLNEYLEYSFETISIENLFYLFLQKNNLTYSSLHKCCKVRQVSSKIKVEDTIEDIVEDTIEDIVEDTIEDIVEDTIEATVEDTIEDKIENTVKVKNNVDAEYLNSLLEEVTIDLELIYYYKNVSNKIKKSTFRNFFFQEYTKFYNKYFDVIDLNIFKKDFIFLYIFYNTFINLDNLEFNNILLNNIFKGYCSCMIKNKADIKQYFSSYKKTMIYDSLVISSYNINMVTSIDLFMFPFFKNIYSSLNNTYDNFMLLLKKKIIILNYSIQETNNKDIFFSCDNKNIKLFFLFVYNKFYDYLFLASVMVKKLENLKHFISLYMDLLILHNNNKCLVIKSIFRNSVCNMITTEDLYLINLLLNVKNPLLLYNLIALDLNIFLTNIFNIKNIIDNPSYNKILYKNLLSNFIKCPSDIECNEHYESFFSLGDISLLNNAILSLDNYIKFNKSFLNLKNFSLSKNLEYNELELLLNDNNLSTLFNMSRLVNIESNFFVENNIIKISKKEIKFFLKFNKYNLNNFYNNELEFLNFKRLIKFTLPYKNKLNINKRHSIGAISISKKLKKKNIVEKPIVDDDKETEAMKRFKAKFDKKNEKTQNVFFAYRQWASDVEYIKAYKACQVKFNSKLLDINDKMWDDVRFLFKDNSVKFFIFIESLEDTERQKLFDILWHDAMNDITIERENRLNMKAYNDWDKLLASVHITNLDMINSFDKKVYIWKTNWKKNNWYLDLGRGPFEIRDDNSTTDYRYKIDEFYNETYLDGKVYEHMNENEDIQKPKKLINWWDSTDWWRKF